MTQLVLVVNSGSSSLKYQLIDALDGNVRAKGLAEKIGEADSRLVHRAAGRSDVELEGRLADHSAALALVLTQLNASGFALNEITAAGHRVVHGGWKFSAPTVIDDEVEAGIESIVPLAPLHNPAALLGIRALRELLPELPQVAVFDTAFHANIPPAAHTYAIPTQLAADQHIRRYGFHGTSVQYVTARTAELLGKPINEVNLVVCHIGNGASVTAVQNGQSVDTSMGLTPLEGLVMGTRSGDIDAGVLFHLARVAGLDIEQLDRLLNRESGLLGMAGQSDMREVRRLADAGDQAARLAIDVYAYRLRKYIAAFAGVVPGLHAVVFTAGVGENDAAFRAEVLGPLAHLGMQLDAQANLVARGVDHAVISSAGSPIKLLVVATNEELEIAKLAAQAVGR